MLQIMEFIFKSLWHFLGTLILCVVVFGGLGQMFSRDTKNYYNKEKEEGGE